MGRIRTIKPELPQSESMGNISREARLLFILTWTLADDEGRLRGNSRMLASLLFPYDDDAPRLMDGWLTELVRERCLDVYQIDGTTYVQIANWLIHQKIDKPSKSKIPPFSEASRILANPPRRTKDQGPEDQGKGKDQGEDGKGPIVVERRGATPDRDLVPKIFGFWQETMESPRSKLDTKRINLIRKALELGYSPRDLCEAIRGCAMSPFHMGQNDRSTKYNGLDLIFRSADKIDAFIVLSKGGATAGSEETMEQRNARITAELLGPDDDKTDDDIIDMEPT